MARGKPSSVASGSQTQDTMIVHQIRLQFTTGKTANQMTHHQRNGEALGNGAEAGPTVAAANPASSSGRDNAVSLNDSISMASFRSTSSPTSTSVADEQAAFCLAERRKRRERLESNLLRFETSVVSTALPWSMRMMIRLNAMPYRSAIG